MTTSTIAHPKVVSRTLLDLTPYGRQEDAEDSPDGWPQTPTFPGWVRHHDKYDDARGESCCGTREARA